MEKNKNIKTNEFLHCRKTDGSVKYTGKYKDYKMYDVCYKKRGHHKQHVNENSSMYNQISDILIAELTAKTLGK